MCGVAPAGVFLGIRVLALVVCLGAGVAVVAVAGRDLLPGRALDGRLTLAVEGTAGEGHAIDQLGHWAGVGRVGVHLGLTVQAGQTTGTLGPSEASGTCTQSAVFNSRHQPTVVSVGGSKALSQ